MRVYESSFLIILFIAPQSSSQGSRAFVFDESGFVIFLLHSAGIYSSKNLRFDFNNNNNNNNNYYNFFNNNHGLTTISIELQFSETIGIPCYPEGN